MLIRNKNSSGNESLGSVFVVAWGRSHITSAKTKYFLEVVLANSSSNSCRITIQQEISPQYLTGQDVIHGVLIHENGNGSKYDVVIKVLYNDDHGQN